MDVRYQGRCLRLTASFGAVVVAPPWPRILDGDELLAGADRNLYVAKQSGRNRTSVETLTVARLG